MVRPCRAVNAKFERCSDTNADSEQGLGRGRTGSQVSFRKISGMPRAQGGQYIKSMQGRKGACMLGT